MPINLFDHVEKKVGKEGEELADPHVNAFYSQVQLERQARDFEKEATSSLFSKISARLFFLMLLIADVFWGLSSLAQITVAACILFSGMIILVPSLLKIASAILILFSPASLLHKQVMDLPTAIAVLGSDLII